MSSLQQLASDHLWLHFTRMSSFDDEHAATQEIPSAKNHPRRIIDLVSSKPATRRLAPTDQCLTSLPGRSGRSFGASDEDESAYTAPEHRPSG